MQERIKELQQHPDPKRYYNKLNYHLKKVQPFRNRTKRTVADQMRLYTRQQKASMIPISTQTNKKLITKTIIREQLNENQHDLISQQHANQNLTHVSSQIKIYQVPGSDRKNVFDRGNSETKGKKIDVSQRGKSLKYWKVQRSEPKFITQIKGFFNTFLSEKDGCQCGPSCQCTEILMQWINVPDELINKNYARLLNEAYRKEVKNHHRERYSETQYSSSGFRDYDSDYQDSNSKWNDRQKHLIQIRKDVIRTQTQCQIFHRKEVHQKMQRILMCYTVQDPEVGYVQSMNIVLSGVLYHVRDEAKSFAICRKLFHQIRRIYLQDFKECYKHVDNIIKQLQLQVLDLYAHLQQIGVQLRVVLFPWILSLLCVVVPLDHLHLIYIGFVKQGWKFIYKTILALFVYHKEQIKQMDQSGDVLVFLSVSNQQQKDRIDWEDIVRFGTVLQLTH